MKSLAYTVGSYRLRRQTRMRRGDGNAFKVLNVEAKSRRMKASMAAEKKKTFTATMQQTTFHLALVLLLSIAYLYCFVSFGSSYALLWLL